MTHILRVRVAPRRTLATWRRTHRGYRPGPAHFVRRPRCASGRQGPTSTPLARQSTPSMPGPDSVVRVAPGTPFTNVCLVRLPVLWLTMYRLPPLVNTPPESVNPVEPATENSCAPTVPVSGVNHRQNRAVAPERV